MKYFEVGNPKRILIKSKEDYLNFIKLNNGVTNLYKSVYNFKYLKSKFTPDYESAIINQMFFDCDSENSLEVCKKFIKYLDNHNLQYYLKQSSFDKFPKLQIYVLVEEDYIEHKKACLMNGMIYLAKEVGLTYGESSSCDLDKATFGDLARICPIAGTYKPKRNSFCSYISKEDLYYINKLKEKAKTGIGKRVIYNWEKFNLKKFDRLDLNQQLHLDNEVLKYDDFKVEFNDKFVDCLPPIIKKILVNYNNYCDNYRNRWRVAIYMRDFGYPESLAKDIIEKYFSKIPNYSTCNGTCSQWDRFVKCKSLWYVYKGEFREFPTIQNLLDEGLEVTEKDKELIEKLYKK